MGVGTGNERPVLCTHYHEARIDRIHKDLMNIYDLHFNLQH